MPAVLAQLEAANTARPHDPDTVLALGLANLWGVSELARDPSQASAAPTRAMEAISSLTEAMSLRPGDARVPGWLGGTLIATGVNANDPALVAQGQSVLAQAVAAFPQFNLFIHALVNQSAPIGSPELASAVDAYFQTLDVCFGTTIDRTNPDASPFLGLQTQAGPNRACWDDPLAPYNWEGFFYAMGDTLVRAGQPAVALRSYQNATLLPTFATYPFHDEVIDRMSTVAARAALYTDADPSNDPELVSESRTQCAACHAR